MKPIELTRKSSGTSAQSADQHERPRLPFVLLMTVATQIIELPADATLLAIQRRLARAQSLRVLLVLPRGSQALANPARLMLIRR
ncbi:MAG: hypothetical protein E3J25_11500, partial [Anaerolineales bacterium]